MHDGDLWDIPPYPFQPPPSPAPLECGSARSRAAPGPVQPPPHLPCLNVEVLVPGQPPVQPKLPLADRDIFHAARRRNRLFSAAPRSSCFAHPITPSPPLLAADGSATAPCCRSRLRPRSPSPPGGTHHSKARGVNLIAAAACQGDLRRPRCISTGGAKTRIAVVPPSPRPRRRPA